MTQKIHVAFEAAMLAGVAGFVWTAAAWAQTPPATDANASQTTSTNETAQDQLSTITVTGTRIIRNGYSSPTPVTVETLEDMQATTPSNIPDALNKLPIFAGNVQTANASNALGGGAAGTANTYGGNYLNLRDMGPIRTLVLVDGRRVPPTTLSGQVDADTLPDQLIQRVDVVTGGASAVYGSDAVVGVVNYVLDKNYKGLEFFAQGGESTYSDDRSYRFGVKAGTDLFGGRGHIIASYGQNVSDGVNRTARSWSADRPVFVGSGSAANPYTLVTNATLSGLTFGGVPLTGPFVGQQFANNGALVPFNPGTRTATPGTNIGGDGGYFPNLTEVFPVATYKGFTRFQYDLTDDLQAYVQFNGADAKTNNINYTAFGVPSYPIYSNNAFLTPAEQAQLNNTGVGSFSFGRFSADLLNDSRINQDTLNLDVTAGLSGAAFGDFKWDAYYTHGQSTLTSTIHNNVYVPYFFAALDAVQGPSGQPVCQVSLTQYANLYPGCAPLDLFGVGNESPAAKSFIYRDTQWKGVNKMDDVATSLSGDAFNDWAGPVSTAFNFEYRKQSLVETTDASPFALSPVVNYNIVNSPAGPVYLPASFVGLRPTGTAASPWVYSTQAPQSGSESVREVSAETVVPLLKDVPLAKSLDISGAVRYTDYSSSGVATTWKGGFTYKPVDELLIRFTKSRDIRAPTLYDLYAGASTVLSTVFDPVSKQTGAVPVLTTGNPNLKPEVSYTTTVGFVYSPSPHFNMSVDYYNINMTNAISTINGSDPIIIAQCQASGGTSPLCGYTVRPTPTSYPTLILNLPANLAKDWTRGFDLDTSYNFMAQELIKGAPGRFDLRLLYSYQPVLNSINEPGATVQKAAGVAGVSADRVAANINYRAGPVSLFWQTRWESSQALSGSSLVYYAGGPLPSIFYHDASLTYDMSMGGYEMRWYFVVDNLLNQAPRIAPSPRFVGAPGAAQPAVPGDDEIGRFFTLGVRMSF